MLNRCSHKMTYVTLLSRCHLSFIVFFAGWLRACSGVVRLDPLRFLVGCCTRRLNQVLFCVISLHALIVLLLIRAPFYVLLIFVGVFCLLIVLVKLSLLAKWLARKTPLRKPNRGECIKRRPNRAYDCVGLLYSFVVLLHDICVIHGHVGYISYFYGMI